MAEITIAGIPANEYKRRWNAKNSEKLKLYKARYLAKPEAKEKTKQYQDIYNKSGIHKLAQKKWYEKNAEREKARVAQWRKNNREKMLAYKREYLQKNLDKHRLHQAKRRAQIYSTRTGKIDLDKLLENMICGICNNPILVDYEIDHIVPLSRGGTHTQDNLQLAHSPCNNTKNNKLMEEL